MSYLPDDDEEPWIENLGALVWPPNVMLRIDPFERHSSPAKRLNAKARLTLLMALAAVYATQREGQSPVLIVLWAALTLVSHGAEFIESQQGLSEEYERAKREREQLEARVQHQPVNFFSGIYAPNQNHHDYTLEQRWLLNSANSGTAQRYAN